MTSRISTCTHERTSRFRMARIQREACDGPTTRDFIHWTVYLSHLINPVKGCGSTLETYGDTQDIIKSLVFLRWRCSRRCDWFRFMKPKISSLFLRAFLKDATVHTNYDYNSFSIWWSLVDIVLQRHGVEAPINDIPADDGPLPGTTISYLCSKPVSEANFLSRI